MVQVFMVVRCHSCKTFQVHQVKKTNKWVCRICNEKQSVVKIYGKGAAKACRKHVQKLNMIQGERERRREERGDHHTPSDHEEEGEKEDRREEGGNHPPCDYANAFTTQTVGTVETQVEHPVVLGDTRRSKSKWTTFIEPHKDEDEDEEEYTTERDGFSQASKTRRKARRSFSERRPHTLAAHNQDEVCAYSSVNLKLNYDRRGSLTCAHSHPDRYTKLDTPTDEHTETGGGHSQSMFDLTSVSASPGNHEEQMSEIKKDLEQFSRKRIPKVSARWSQFMCEEEDSEEEEEEGVGTSGEKLKSSSGHTTHILADKSSIARFTL